MTNNSDGQVRDWWPIRALEEFASDTETPTESAVWGNRTDSRCYTLIDAMHHLLHPVRNDRLQRRVKDDSNTRRDRGTRIANDKRQNLAVISRPNIRPDVRLQSSLLSSDSVLELALRDGPGCLGGPSRTFGGTCTARPEPIGHDERHKSDAGGDD